MTAKVEFDYRRATIVVLAIGLVLRMGWAALVPVDPISDSAAYDAFARTIVEHGVYGWTADQPSAFWPVGTSAIYAGLYFLFGHSYVPVVILNIILGIGIVALTMMLTHVFFDDATAIVAGGLMAVWPSQVAYVTILASELPFTFFVMLGMTAWFQPNLSKLVRAVASGLAFGAAAYIRPVSLVLPFVLWLSSIPNWRKLLGDIQTVAVAMIVIGLTIAPWSVRNSKLFDGFVLVSTNGGVNLWMGNNPKTDGFYMPPPASTSGLNEHARDKALGDEARRYIIDNPSLFVLRTIKKALLLHVGETVAIHWNAGGIKRSFGENALLLLKLLTQGFWTIALLLSLVGIGIVARRDGILSALFHPIVLTWAYFTAVYAITVIQDRYHFPSHPLVAALAAVTIVSAMQLRHRRLQTATS